jgi:hypothetical protein
MSLKAFSKDKVHKQLPYRWKNKKDRLENRTQERKYYLHPYEELDLEGYDSDDKVLPFKSPLKNWSSLKGITGKNFPIPIQQPQARIPQKEPRKLYSIPIISSGPEHYQIDLMKTLGTNMGELVQYNYLIAIGVNNRYGFAEPVNLQSQEGSSEIRLTVDIQSLQAVMPAMYGLVKNIKELHPTVQQVMLEGDGERSFKYADLEWLQEHTGVTVFIESHDDPYHTRLSIINRFIRTLRDMAYTFIGETLIHLDIMQLLLERYNNAYHKSLSEVIGFDVSPMMLVKNRDLEAYFVRKMIGKQFNSVMRNHIPIGTPVYVYNFTSPLEKRRRDTLEGEWIVTGRKGFSYEVSSVKGQKKVVPRRFLKAAV